MIDKEFIERINAHGTVSLDQLYTLFIDKVKAADPDNGGLEIVVNLMQFLKRAEAADVRALPDGKLNVLINLMDLGLREASIRLVNDNELEES